MPSRKKAQGKARKAKQAAAAAPTAHGGFNRTNANPVPCDHLGEHRHKLSQDDTNVAGALKHMLDECTSKANAIEDDNTFEDALKMANDFYDNIYQQFSVVRKDLIRRMIVAWGTECYFSAANLLSVDKWIYGNILIIIIEARDKYNGAWDANVGGEVFRFIADIYSCPRAIIRFFHRRNSCDCLQDMYYKLKETTKRTSMCWNCAKVVDIKLIKECEFCKTANYCSYECAVAFWRWHQKDCRVLTKLRKQKERSDSFNDIEAVD